MANYDDIFNASQSKESEEKSFTPFDKDEWAAQKKQERTLSTILCKRIMKHNHISQPRPHRISSFPRIRLQFG